jgi:L-lactate dehydrogenase complex protein LldG
MLASLGSSHHTPDEGSVPIGSFSFRRVGNLSADERVAQFTERLVEYRASVVESTPDAVADHVRAFLAQRASTSVVAPRDLPAEWLAVPGLEVSTDDPPLSVTQLDELNATVSSCAVAISETGTIVLDAGPRQGCRVISLIPDHLIVVVEESQIVELVPEAVARLDATSTQTWISGPSATSDIELERIEGVHGPRVLDVIVVRSS